MMDLKAETFDNLSREQFRRMVHELRAQQIELERQNKELRQAWQKLTVSHEQYLNLYEYAPIGYLTIGSDGLIKMANMTAAEMLNRPKQHLIEQRFADFIVNEDRDIYYRCRSQLLEKKTHQCYDIRLKKKKGKPFWARINNELISDPQDIFSSRIVISDISRDKQAESIIHNACRDLENKVQKRTHQFVTANAILQDKILDHESTLFELNEYTRRQEILNLLLQLSMDELPLEEFLNRSIVHITAFPGLGLKPSGIIFLKDPGSQNLVMTSHFNISEEQLQTCAIRRFGECHCGQAALSAKPIFASFQDDSHEILYQDIRPHGHYCVPIVAADKNVLGVLTLFVDEGGFRNLVVEKTLIAAGNVLAGIIERTRTKYSLAKTNQLLSSIYDAADSVALVTTDFGKDNICITSFSPGAEKMFGYSQDEIIGQPSSLLNIPEHNKFLPGTRKRLQSGQEISFPDTCLIRKSGERFAATVMIHPLFDDCNTIIGTLGVCTDISHLKMVQTELSRTNKELEKRVEERTVELQKSQQQILHVEKLGAIGRLSASIAHEVNNPMQGIITVLNGISKRAHLEDEDMVLLQSALHECTRIKKLIRSLQDFNRPSSGKKEPVDLQLATDTLLLLCSNDCKKRNIHVVTDYGKDVPPAMVVSDQIKQVILNLLTNAADACPTGGTIHISTVFEEDAVLVRIKDTGVGIPPENIDRIFEPFFTTKPEVKGTGLGLTISYGIIKEHKGTICVESEAGKGATFTITLPFRDIQDTVDGT